MSMATNCETQHADAVIGMIDHAAGLELAAEVAVFWRERCLFGAAFRAMNSAGLDPASYVPVTRLHPCTGLREENDDR